jgi:hypothetical protein
MNTKTLLVALLLVLGAGAALSVWWSGDDSDLLPQPWSHPTTALPASVADAAASDLDTAAAVPAQTAVEAATARDATALEGTAMRPLPDDAEWITVTVVDKATGASIGGAEVLWHDETAQEFLAEGKGRYWWWDPALRSIWRNPENLAQHAGWRTRADAQGVARVTLREDTVVVAMQETRYGSLQLRKNSVTPPGGHKLQVEPDRQLRVRVVDDQGQPVADVPVAVAPYDEDGDIEGGFAWATHGDTDSSGAATIVHLQSLLRQAQDQELDLEKLQWHVRSTVMPADHKGVPFSIDNPPTEVIELRLPATGTIRARAVLAGRPLASFRGAQLQQIENDEQGRRRRYYSARFAKVDDDGYARWRHVPLGKRYQVSSSDDDGLQSETTGPTVVGQEIEVVLSPSNEAIMLKGRLLLADRQPLANETVTVRVRGQQLRHHGETTTDEHGRFLLSVGQSRKDNKVDEASFQLQKKDIIPLRAELTPRTLRPGIEDVGDLVLEPGPLVVGGRLVAADAPYTKPVHLAVEREEPPNGNRPARWRQLGELLLHQDKQGNFTIRGKPAAGRYRLTVRGSETLPMTPIEFPLGTADLEVRLDRGNALAASVMLPERCDTNSIRAKLVSLEPDPKTNKPRELPVDLESQGGERHDLRWSAVPPGSWTLELGLVMLRQPLHTVAGIQVPPPEGGDPRLVDIDLRPMVRPATLQLYDAAGAPLDDADGVLFPTGQPEAGEWLGHQVWAPKSNLLLPTAPLELLVGIREFQPRRIYASSDRLDVRLDPWPKLTLTFPGMPTPPDGCSVHAELQLSGEEVGSFRTQWDSGKRSEWLQPDDGANIENGKAEVPIGDGTYRIQIHVQGNRRSVQINQVQPTQVMATSGPVAVMVAAEEWQRVFEQVKAPPK